VFFRAIERRFQSLHDLQFLEAILSPSLQMSKPQNTGWNPMLHYAAQQPDKPRLTGASPTRAHSKNLTLLVYFLFCSDLQ
jgi:hypothetical protein